MTYEIHIAAAKNILFKQGGLQAVRYLRDTLGMSITESKPLVDKWKDEAIENEAANYLTIDELRQQNESLRKDIEGLQAINKEAERNAYNASVDNSKLIGRITLLEEENKRLRDALMRWENEWIINANPAQRANNYSIEQQIKKALWP